MFVVRRVNVNDTAVNTHLQTFQRRTLEHRVAGEAGYAVWTILHDRGFLVAGVLTVIGPWYDNLKKPSWKPPD